MKILKTLMALGFLALAVVVGSPQVRATDTLGSTVQMLSTNNWVIVNIGTQNTFSTYSCSYVTVEVWNYDTSAWDLWDFIDWRSEISPPHDEATMGYNGTQYAAVWGNSHYNQSTSAYATFRVTAYSSSCATEFIEDIFTAYAPTSGSWSQVQVYP